MISEWNLTIQTGPFFLTWNEIGMGKCHVYLTRIQVTVWEINVFKGWIVWLNNTVFLFRMIFPFGWRGYESEHRITCFWMSFCQKKLLKKCFSISCEYVGSLRASFVLSTQRSWIQCYQMEFNCLARKTANTRSYSSLIWMEAHSE